MAAKRLSALLSEVGVSPLDAKSAFAIVSVVAVCVADAPNILTSGVSAINYLFSVSVLLEPKKDSKLPVSITELIKFYDLSKFYSNITEILNLIAKKICQALIASLIPHKSILVLFYFP